MKSWLLFVSVFVFQTVAGTALASEHVQLVETNKSEYAITVGGTRGPLNEAIIIENVGDKDIINPRIRINARFDWFDLESITAEAISGCSTDQEKAMAIWRFVTENCHYGGPYGDGSLLNPVRLLNITGANICANWATAVVSLAEQAGLKARIWEIGHHTVPEVYFNGRWHLIDSRIGGNFGLLRDNRTIASFADLENDPFYLDRCLLRNPDSDSHQVAMYYVTSQDNYIETYYEKERKHPREMALTLRPGEKLIRYFSEGDKWYGWGAEGSERPQWYGRKADSFEQPQAFTSGQIVFKPDLNRFPLSRFVNSSLNAKSGSEDGISPAVHVDDPRSERYSMASRAYFKVESPWPIIGGRIAGRAYAYGASSLDTAAISVRVGFRGTLWSMKNEGERSFDATFDKALGYGEGGVYSYTAGFWFSCPPDSIPYEKNYQPPVHDRPVQAGIEEFTLTTDIQVAPKSVPALSLGRNTVVYTDETPGAHRVKITHIWTERSDNHPPLPPRKPGSPADGKRAGSVAPVLSWQPSRDTDRQDTVAEYQIFLSLNPRCIWPLSPNFDIPTGSAGSSFKVPEGWLNPGTAYYWKVRARDNRGVWGRWSEIWKFTTP